MIDRSSCVPPPYRYLPKDHDDDEEEEKEDKDVGVGRIPPSPMMCLLFIHWIKIVSRKYHWLKINTTNTFIFSLFHELMWMGDGPVMDDASKCSGVVCC